MDAGFWLERWEANRIAFHEDRANGLLVRHYERLGLGAGDRVLLPLCGKTRDVGWLLSRGHRVVGVELSRLAVDQLFSDLGAEPEIVAADAASGGALHYATRGLDVFAGDIFALRKSRLGHVDAVYDRAALVALPPEMRSRYSRHLMDLTGGAPQLLISYEYDQSLMDGPPFSVSEAEVREHYGDRYALTRLSREEVDGGLKGTRPVWEIAWLLERVTAGTR